MQRRVRDGSAFSWWRQDFVEKLWICKIMLRMMRAVREGMKLILQRELCLTLHPPPPTGPDHDVGKISHQLPSHCKWNFWTGTGWIFCRGCDCACCLPLLLLSHTVKVFTAQALGSAASPVSPGHPSYRGKIIMQSTGSFRLEAGGTASIGWTIGCCCSSRNIRTQQNQDGSFPKPLFILFLADGHDLLRTKLHLEAFFVLLFIYFQNYFPSKLIQRTKALNVLWLQVSLRILRQL